MYRGHTIGVVVPAYNEEDHIGGVLETIPRFVDRVYAVDDRSTDATWEIIRSAANAVAGPNDGTGEGRIRSATTIAPESPTPAAENSITDGGAVTTPRVVPIRHETNQGAGAALRTGYLRAREDAIDIVVSMDADGQMDPEHLPRLLDPIVDDVADYTKGNRLSNREDRKRMPRFRLFGNSLLTVLTKIASGYWHIQDPQNGYTAITHEALCAVEIGDIPDDHDYTNDLLVRLNECEMRVADVAMPAVYHDEESTIRYRTFVPRTSITLFRGFSRRLLARYVSAGFHPVPVLYAIGIVGLLGSVGYGLVVVAPAVGNGTLPTVRSDAALGIAAAVILLVVAARLDARTNADLEVTM